MPTELCWKCKQIRKGVTLYGDDRCCPACIEENDKKLAAIREERKSAGVEDSTEETLNLPIPPVAGPSCSVKRINGENTVGQQIHSRLRQTSARIQRNVIPSPPINYKPRGGRSAAVPPPPSSTSPAARAVTTPHAASSTGRLVNPAHSTATNVKTRGGQPTFPPPPLSSSSPAIRAIAIPHAASSTIHPVLHARPPIQPPAVDGVIRNGGLAVAPPPAVSQDISDLAEPSVTATLSTVPARPHCDINCPQCGDRVGSGHEENTITCNICDGLYHQSCTKIPPVIFGKLKSIVEITGWVCATCQISARNALIRTQAAVTELSQQMAGLHQSVAELRERVEMSTSVTSAPDAQRWQNPVHQHQQMPSIQSSTALMVHRTLNDVARRRRNVVISGLVESGHDRASFLDLCQNYLSVKPVVKDGGCVRIGKQQVGKPRRLLVKLQSEETAAVILRDARRLRYCSDQYTAASVYINPDLSREAAQAAFERRQQRRARRAASEETPTADDDVNDFRRSDTDDVHAVPAAHHSNDIRQPESGVSDVAPGNLGPISNSLAGRHR